MALIRCRVRHRAAWIAYTAGILALFGACVHAAAGPAVATEKLDGALQRTLASVRVADTETRAFPVIVQREAPTDRQEAEELAQWAGGRCDGMLDEIGAFCAEVPAAGIAALAARPDVR